MSQRNGSIVNIQAVQDNRTLIMATEVFDGPGTYEFGSLGSEWIGSFSIISGGSWSIVSGEITILNDCENYMEGTFSFTAESSSGSIAEFSDGEFLVEF